MHKIHPPRNRRHPGVKMLGSILLLFLVMLCLNLLAWGTEHRFGLRLDASPNQFTALSDTTLEVLEELQAPVHIYSLYQEGTQNELRMTLDTLLGKYAARSSQISLGTIDPVTEPGRILPFAPENSSVSEGSLLVTNQDETRGRLIVAGELFNYTQSQSDGSYQPSSFIGENKLTSALLYVSSADAPRVFFLTGHDEIASSYCTMLTGQLRSSNYEVEDLTLGSDGQLRPGDTVLMLAPSVDLTSEEYQILQTWLDEGGRLFYVSNPTTDTSRMTNLERLLSYYNLGFSDGVVVAPSQETDSYLSSPLCLIPTPDSESEITEGLSGRLLLPQCGAIQMPDMPLPGFSYQELLTSSADSFLKPVTEDDSIFIRSPEDPTGPFVLAMSAVRVNDADDPSMDTRILLAASPYLLVDSNYINSSYNLEFAAKGIDWLVNQETSVPIFARPVASTALLLPDASAFWQLSAVVVLVIPSLFLLLGVSVWIKRRHL